MIKHNEVPYARVLEAVLQVARDNPEADWKTWYWYDQAAKITGVSSDSASRWVSSSWQRFQRQVLRALKVLADEGALVRYGQGTGTGYRTAALQRRIDGNYARTQEKRTATEARFAAIRERLKALGFDGKVVLSSGDWERLLDLAEKGSRG